MPGRKILRDLEAGVPATDHEHGPRRHLVRSSVANGVRLEDIAAEPLGQLRYIGRLEGAGRDHNLLGADRPSVNFEAEQPVGASVELFYLAVQFDPERLGVALEVR